MNKNSKKKIWLIVLILSVAVFLITVVYLVTPFLLGREPFDKYYSSTTDTGSLSTSLEDVLPDNPIDFSKLHEEINTDIYAWIKIPNTNIDYPILQSYEQDDNYYIKRDEYKNKTSGGSGAIYTQKKNRLDFSDPNTLIYGHHNSTGDRFTKLMSFKDENFFKENKIIYIYTPGHILTYEVFAAYLYDDRHILNAFDFTNEDVYAAYLKSCLNPASMVKNVREGVTLTVEDRIITLSTCNNWYRKETVRYLVQGVLRNDERTK